MRIMESVIMSSISDFNVMLFSYNFHMCLAMAAITVNETATSATETNKFFPFPYHTDISR